MAFRRRRIRRKHDEELRWWLTTWEPVLQQGGFFPGDALDFIDDDEPHDTYAGRRWQQARAEVQRVVGEAGLESDRFFAGKVVVDIGPGPLGFPDACPARLAIGVDPLADRFAEHGLLLPDSQALYLATRAERVPLLSDSVDVLLARNSLDHVDEPEQVLREARRLLRPGGTLILNFDIGHAPTATEPHTLSLERVRAALEGLTVRRQQTGGRAHGDEGDNVVLVAEKDWR